MFSRQFPCPIKRTNSRGHTIIIEGPKLFCQKSSFHCPKKKNTSFKACKKWNSCFLRLFKLAKNEIHLFWSFWLLSFQKMKFIFWGFLRLRKWNSCLFRFSKLPLKKWYQKALNHLPNVPTHLPKLSNICQKFCPFWSPNFHMQQKKTKKSNRTTYLASNPRGHFNLV